MKPGRRSLLPALVCLGLAAAGAMLWWKPPSEEARVLEAASRQLLARAEQTAARADGFDAESALAALPQSAHNGAVFRFDERLAEARGLGRRGSVSVDPADPGRHTFEYEGGDAVTLLPSQDHVIEDGVLKFEHERDRWLMSEGDLRLDRNAVGDIELRIKVEETKTVVLGWSHEPLADVSERDKRAVGEMRIDTIPDGRFHTYRIDATTVLRRRNLVAEEIRAILLLPSDARREQIEIDYLRFIPKRDEYARSSAGRTYEILGGELRAALFVNTPWALAYRVAVPDDSPRMRFGLGMLDEGDPVRFAVDVIDADGQHDLWAQEVSATQRWQDVELDLDRWAGRDVEIVLRSESDAGNIAYWSNPIVRGAPKSRFNVFLVLEDTLRADYLSTYGNERETSPVKDAWAREGVVFERAFSQATKTRPSTPSFMTSLYPSATGVWSHTQVLDERYLTLAEVMRSQGYATASIVQNSNAGPAAGLHQGFDQVFDRTLTGSEALYLEGVNAWLEENAEQNFFLYAHMVNPHGPYEPLPPFDAWYHREGPGGTPVESDSRLDPEGWDAATVEGRRLRYSGEILQNDFWFARVLDQLDALGIRDETLIVFLSDHGEHMGERGHWSHNPPAYTQVIHVPLIMVHPAGQANLPAGRRVSEVVQLVDVMPSILEAAGIDRDALLLQGDSLLPLARGERVEAWRDRAAYSDEATLIHTLDEDEVSASIFVGDAHLLNSRALDAPLLFDLATDPQETQPIDGPWISHALERRVLPVMAQVRLANVRIWQGLVRDLPRVVEYDPDAQEQLRALGYIE